MKKKKKKKIVVKMFSIKNKKVKTAKNQHPKNVFFFLLGNGIVGTVDIQF